MTMPTAIQSGFSKYATFSGRARRSEFWYFALFYFLVMIVAAIINVLLGGKVTFLIFIALLAFLLPSIALGVRRMHDLDKSGWWIFIPFVPLVGGIIYLIWVCSEGTIGPNRFGEDPATA